MKIELFHVIADANCAEVRRHLVQTGWSEKTQFRNIAYESHAEALKSLIGGLDVPCLAIEGQGPLKEKSEILTWLSEHSPSQS